MPCKAKVDSFKLKSLEQMKTKVPFTPPQKAIAEKAKLKKTKKWKGIKS